MPNSTNKTTYNSTYVLGKEHVSNEKCLRLVLNTFLKSIIPWPSDSLFLLHIHKRDKLSLQVHIHNAYLLWHATATTCLWSWHLCLNFCQPKCHCL